MNCPKCGKELKISHKDPSFGLCANCRKKFKLASLEEYYQKHEELSNSPSEEKPASQPSPDSRKPAKGEPTQTTSPKKSTTESENATPKKTVAKSTQGAPKKAKKNRTAPQKKTATKSEDSSRHPAKRKSVQKRSADTPSSHRPHHAEAVRAHFVLPRTLIGAFSILFALFIAVQIYVPLFAHLISSSNEINKKIGILVAVCFLLGGIVALILKEKNFIVGFIIPAIFFLVGAFAGILLYGNYTDLRIFSVVSGVFGVCMILFFLLSTRMNKVLAILIPLLILIIICALVFIRKPVKQAAVAIDSDTQTTETKPESISENTSAVESIDFSTDNFNIKYVKHEIGKNYEDKDCLLVFYDFTNNTKDTLTASSSVVLTAMQDGTNCQTAITETPSKEEDNYSKDVKPGKTLSVCQAFTITNKSDVTITINDMAALDGKAQSQVLKLK